MVITLLIATNGTVPGIISLRMMRPVVVSINLRRFIRGKVLHPDLDACLQIDLTGVKRNAHFFGRSENFAFTTSKKLFPGHVIDAENHVLGRDDDRLTVGRGKDVVGAHHQNPRLHLAFDRQREVDCHLVAVEVGVKGGTDQADGVEWPFLR